MNFELMEALRVIEREKGINFEILLEALANALVTAYKRMPNAAGKRAGTRYTYRVRVGGGQPQAVGDVGVSPRFFLRGRRRCAGG